MGTLGYMSPEQVKGKPADARSDIFAFGAILYEMLSGQRAFHRETAAETISAILREDPPDLSDDEPERAAGARAPRRALPREEPRAALPLGARPRVRPRVACRGRRPRACRSRRLRPMERKRRSCGRAFAVLVAGAVGAAYSSAGAPESSVPAGRRLFQPADVQPADDLQRPVRSRRQDGRVQRGREGEHAGALRRPRRVSGGADPWACAACTSSPSLRAGSSRSLTGARYIAHNVFQGTLAQMPLEGGAPRDVLENVREADWSPDGASLAVIREVGGKDRLEFPVGKVLCETGGYFSDLRFSPTGDRIAFFEHPVRWDDRGWSPSWISRARRPSWPTGSGARRASPGRPTERRSCSRPATATALQGLRRDTRGPPADRARERGRPDDPRRAPGRAVARDAGRLLAGNAGPSARTDRRARPVVARPLRPPVLSADGKTILFVEYSGSLGANYAVCLRQHRRFARRPAGRGDAHGPVAGREMGARRRAHVAAAARALSHRRRRGAPARPRRNRELRVGHVLSRRQVGARLRPRAGARVRGATSRRSPEASRGPSLRKARRRESSRRTRARSSCRRAAAVSLLYSEGGGEGRPVPGTTPDDVAIRWSRDGGSFLVCRGERGSPARRAGRARGREAGLRADARAGRPERGRDP